MLKILLFSFSFLASAISLKGAPLPSPRSTEEALFLRRIGGFWKDKEYASAKSQIEEYFSFYPNSPFNEHFYLMLGDMALIENKFEEAMGWYEKVISSSLKKEAQLKRWHALYKLQQYPLLRTELSRLDEPLSDEIRFYLAEACFREASTLYKEAKEEASPLLSQAVIQYQALLESPSFSLSAKLSLAEIHPLQGAFQEACCLFDEIAKACEDLQNEMQEEALLCAAERLSQVDPSKAAFFFEKICTQGQKKRSEAASFWFHLMVSKEAWGSLEEHQLLFLSLLPPRPLSLCHFYLGKISHEKGLFSNAADHLRESLKGPLSGAQEKAILLLQMKGAQEINDFKAFESAYRAFKEKYGKSSSELPLLRTAKAKFYAKQGNPEKALHILSKIKKCEEAEVEKIRLLAILQRYEEAHAACETFLSFHPHHQKMKQYAVEISLGSISQGSTRDKYDILAQDLKSLLNESDSLSDDDVKKYALLLAKAFYSLDLLGESKEILNAHVERFGPSADVHFLLALCSSKMDNEPHQLILHGEEALSLNPCLDDAPQLHLALFNAYLTLSKEKRDLEKEHSAAEHLYAASQVLPISLEKRVWMAHHYSHIAHKTMNDNEAKKAIGLMEPLLESKEQWFQFEQEALLLASLYGLIGRSDEQNTLLNKLHSFQIGQPQLRWRHKEKTELELANFHFIQKKWDEARQVYEKIEASSNAAISSEARLQLSRVLIQQLSTDEKKEGSVHTLAILHRLKDLQLRKILAQEPIHLEAAIEYAEFCASLKPAQEQEETLLNLYTQMKEDFTNQEDLWSKDYHGARELFPDKELIYQAYMRYIDAKICFLQSLIAKRQGNFLDARTKESAARALFSTLLQGKYAVTKFLIEKGRHAFS